MADFLRKMRGLFGGQQEEEVSAPDVTGEPADDLTEDDADIMTELFGAYVTEPEEEEPEVKMYDNYDTDELSTEEITAAAAALLDEPAASTYSLDDYAPKRVLDSEPDVVEYYDLDELVGKVKEDIPVKRPKRNKKAIVGALTATGILCIILSVLLVWWMSIDPLADYAQLIVGRGNVIQAVSVNGTLEPYVKYEIVPRVSGEIVEAHVEVGDKVREGDTLYQIDDEEAELAVQRAEKEVERAKAYQSETAAAISELKIYAPASGVISDLTLRTGSTVTGSEVAKITKSDESVVSVIPSVRGIVKSVSVREGQTVSSGQLMATLKSESLEATRKSQGIDIENAELLVESAKNALEDYEITSPTDGVVLEMNGKQGDNAVAGDSENPLMVIADMDRMKLVIQVDELEIWDMEVGQEVIVTADAFPDETYEGEITNIANEGTEVGDGVTTYAVEITVEDTDDLKAGMHVSAQIILDSATNVITIPEEALMEADGKNAAVFIKNVSGEEEEPTASPNPEEAEEIPYSWITPPEGCRVVPVRYGISDGVNVRIISGLREGDILVYKTENPILYNVEASASPSPDQTPKPNGSSRAETQPTPAATESGNNNNENDGNSESSPTPTPPSTRGRLLTPEDDVEELRRQGLHVIQ